MSGRYGGEIKGRRHGNKAAGRTQPRDNAKNDPSGRDAEKRFFVARFIALVGLAYAGALVILWL